MKNFMLLLGILLFTPMVFAGHADDLRVNTFLTEAFPGVDDTEELIGTNSDNEYCDVRFSTGHHLFLHDYNYKSAAVALYDVKVSKLDNLNSIKFTHKRVVPANFMGRRKLIEWSETTIFKTESGYKFTVTFRRGHLKKFHSKVDCTITQ